MGCRWSGRRAAQWSPARAWRGNPSATRARTPASARGSRQGPRASPLAIRTRARPPGRRPPGSGGLGEATYGETLARCLPKNRHGLLAVPGRACVFRPRSPSGPRTVDLSISERLPMWRAVGGERALTRADAARALLAPGRPLRRSISAMRPPVLGDLTHPARPQWVRTRSPSARGLSRDHPAPRLPDVTQGEVMRPTVNRPTVNPARAPRSTGRSPPRSFCAPARASPARRRASRAPAGTRRTGSRRS